MELVLGLALVGLELRDLRLPLIEQRDLESDARAERDALVVAETARLDGDGDRPGPARGLRHRERVGERLQVPARGADVEALLDGDRLEALERGLVLRELRELRPQLPCRARAPGAHRLVQLLAQDGSLALRTLPIERRLCREPELVVQREVTHVARLVLPGRELRRGLGRLLHESAHRHDLLGGLRRVERLAHLGGGLEDMVGDLELRRLELRRRHALAHRHRDDVEEVLLHRRKQVRRDVLRLPRGATDAEHGIREETGLHEIRLRDRELLELRPQMRTAEQRDLHGRVGGQLSLQEIVDRLLGFPILLGALIPPHGVTGPGLHVLRDVVERRLGGGRRATSQKRDGSGKHNRANHRSVLTSSGRASCCTSDRVRAHSR